VIRLSVTDLESFRYWRDDEESELPDLLRRLQRLDPPTDQMEAGRAFAKLFEQANVGEIKWATVDGWRFRFDLDAELELAPVRELKTERVFQTPSGPVTLVGMVDGTTGRRIRDQKLTQRWDAEKYTESLQWRAYLVMLGADTFTYDVFVGRYKGQEVTIGEYHPLTFYAYPNMAEDVQRAVNELAAIVAHHLPERVVANA